eukprot:CAMPEP_0175061520 /NCGR_PEP_ID=MMETSP0052_2-20121109/13629_1 /TAXON_ID=51329 ORGANISM="Polytomella parva, Strain SAG 63-3" /NCGR_SAMPLE_ID=MMETSP0052_2 /ASSEMBLY_ACC=CAM_ASM_000194 /LENGTH=182 /DNA_ID=CAMNT_0016327381 /DNA_START=276 /DNA_END=820 /DNA_ORIENTATION=+
MATGDNNAYVASPPFTSSFAPSPPPFTSTGSRGDHRDGLSNSLNSSRGFGFGRRGSGHSNNNSSSAITSMEIISPKPACNDKMNSETAIITEPVVANGPNTLINSASFANVKTFSASGDPHNGDDDSHGRTLARNANRGQNADWIMFSINSSNNINMNNNINDNNINDNNINSSNINSNNNG